MSSRFVSLTRQSILIPITSHNPQVVLVLVLLAMDFWNCRVGETHPISVLCNLPDPPQNVAGRKLVGLRFWNQVDDDGESYWVFESRDVRVIFKHVRMSLKLI